MVVVSYSPIIVSMLNYRFCPTFFDAKDTTNKGNELIILLDNSFSMQAKGAKGELLKRSIQDLLEELPENQQFHYSPIPKCFGIPISNRFKKNCRI